jgi:hypothetical protein
MLLAFLGRLAYFALLGFIGIILFGPLLAMTIVLAVFAALGLVFGLPLRLLGLRRPMPWQRLQGLSHRAWGTVHAGYRSMDGALAQPPVHPLGRLAYLGLFGLVALILFGPAVALLIILGVFAALGLVFGLPLRLLGFGKPLEWDRVRDAGQRCWGTVRAGCGRVHSAIPQDPVYLEKARSAGRFMGRIFRETLCGALVGGMLGLIPALQNGFHAQPLVLGIGIGFIVGALVALGGRAALGEAA